MAAQPLNHADRMAVRPLLVPRITSMVLAKAKYLLDLGQSATADQKAWAKQAVLSPGLYAEHVSQHLVSETEFLENGSGIDDAALETLVGTKLDLYFIPA